MSKTVLELHPLAPLLLRDGRPFASGGEESRAQSLPTPLPHTLAGFIRTQLGGRQGWNWRDDAALKRHLEALHGVPVHATLQRDDTFMFPAPLNAVVDKSGKVYRSVPPKSLKKAGTDAPDDLLPLQFDEQTDSNFKPESGYAYWPKEAMQRWLLGEKPDQLEKIGGPEVDERTHVAMDSEKGVGGKGKLFTVSYRSFEDCQQGQYHRWSLRVKTDVAEQLEPIGHLGGERRPVALTDVGNHQKWPNLSEFEGLKAELLRPERQKIFFVLTTPALFRHGWKPDWLGLSADKAAKHDGNSLPSGIKPLMMGGVRLVGAAVGRKVPVSGWNVRTGQPKPVRWAVPAGSVYFLEVKQKQDFDREAWLKAWMRPLSDEQNDQRDGFGLALWGVWN